jgi:predicted Rdx family selenoprotein
LATTAATVELVGGRAGVFDIDVDGARVYSKHEAGAFPSDDDIERLFPG